MSNAEAKEETLFNKIKQIFISSNENGMAAFNKFYTLIQKSVKGEVEANLNLPYFVADLVINLPKELWFSLLPQETTSPYQHMVFGLFVKSLIHEQTDILIHQQFESQSTTEEEQNNTTPNTPKPKTTKKLKTKGENDKYWKKAQELGVHTYIYIYIYIFILFNTILIK